MRRAVAFLFLLAACGGDDPVPPAPPPIVPAPGVPEVDWVQMHAAWFDLEVHVPKEWSTNRQVRLNGAEIHFGGPGMPGKRPELIFGWEPSTQSLEAWGAEKIRSFENSPVFEVRDRGRATVAGMPALYCILETKVSREVVYYFVGHGFRGFVRGLAPIGEFPRYAPIFEEAARRLRYNRQ